MSDRWIAGTLVVVLAVGALPYLPYLPLWPASEDAAIWITRSAPIDSDWHVRVLTDFHVGRCYRPVTALTYSLNYGLGGFAATPYRLTDLLVHLLCGWFVYLLYRRLAPAFSRWGGVTATVVFMAHPVGQLIVPSLSRRSYSLCTLLGLGALILLAPPGRGRPSRPVIRATLAALLLTASVLANELGVTLVFAAGVVLLSGMRDDPGRRGWSLAAGAAIAAGVAAAAALRFGAIQGLGGYPDMAEGVGPTAAAAWRTIGAWHSSPNLPGWIALVGGVVIVGTVCLRSAWLGATGKNDARLPFLCVVWLLGFTAVAAAVKIWFPREAYVALPPLALLVGSLVDRGRPRWWLGATSVLLVIGWFLYWSVTGSLGNDAQVVRLRKTDSMLRDLHGALASYPEPATVGLAIPRYWRKATVEPPSGPRRHGGTHHARTWINGLLHDRPITVESRLSYIQEAWSDPLPPEARVVDNAVEFVMPRGVGYFVPGRERPTRSADGRDVVRLLPADDDDRKQLIYFHDGTGGRLIPFESAPGAEPPVQPSHP